MGREINYYTPETLDRLGPFNVAKVNGRSKIVGPHGFFSWPKRQDPFGLHRALIDEYEAWWTAISLPRVYFIGEDLRLDGIVKIGIANDPRERLKTLQTAHPNRLQLFAIEYGGRGREVTLHQRWSKQRMNGEWFRISAPILKHVLDLAETMPSRLAELDQRAVSAANAWDDLLDGFGGNDE